MLLTRQKPKAESALTGTEASRIQRLMQHVDVQNQSAQIQSVLEQLLQLSYRLAPKTSYVKTRSLAAIALQYAQFKQFDQAFKVANTLQEKQTREQAIGRIQCAARV